MTMTFENMYIYGSTILFCLTFQWESAYYINNLTHDIPEIGDVIKGWREVLDSYDDSDDDKDNYK